MIYDLYSRKSRTHLSIDVTDNFDSFWKFLGTFVYGEELKKRMTKINITDGTHIDKFTTKLLCEQLDRNLHSLDLEKHITKTIFEDFPSEIDRKYKLIEIINFYQFFNFIKITRGGIFICRREK